MQTEANLHTASQQATSDEEVSDLLIAISVVAKRLAQKINEKTESMEGDKKCTEKTTDWQDRLSK